MLMCVVGVAAGCVAVLAGCDGSSAPLPTEYDWVFESLTVTEDDAVHIYKVSVGGEYDGMTVDADMVKVSFNTGAFFSTRGRSFWTLPTARSVGESGRRVPNAAART